MKKKIFALFAIFLCFVLLVSCSEMNDGIKENDSDDGGEVSETHDTWASEFDTEGSGFSTEAAKTVYSFFENRDENLMSGAVGIAVIEDHETLCEVYDFLDTDAAMLCDIRDLHGEKCPEGTYAKDYFEYGYLVAVFTYTRAYGDRYTAKVNTVNDIFIELEQFGEPTPIDAWGQLIVLVPMVGEYGGENVNVSRLDKKFNGNN